MFRFAAVFLIVITLKLTVFAFKIRKDQERSQVVGSAYRLYSDVTPTHYDIHLTFPENVLDNLEEETFQGEILITLKALAPTTRFNIHGNNIVVDEYVLYESTIPERNLLYEIVWTKSGNWGGAQMYALETTVELDPAKTYILMFDYNATIRHEPGVYTGLFRSVYYNEGEIQCLLATTFETSYARSVFPCFDEPSFKATFRLAITHDAKDTAFANMPLDTIEKSGSRATSTFRTTPLMSIHLLSFLLTPPSFNCSTGKPLDGNQDNIVCSASKYEPLREMALTITEKLMTDMNKLTGIHYKDSGIGKFQQASMSNVKGDTAGTWGLTVYADEKLLYDPEASTVHERILLVRTIAHQVVNMWFGNLLSFDWWTEYFLTEGFANYFEKFIINMEEPEYPKSQTLIIETVLKSMIADAKTDASALVTDRPIQSLDEIQMLFQDVSYYKGCSLFRMFSETTGKENSLDIMRDFIEKFSYKSITVTDVLDYFEHNSQPEKLPFNTSFADMAENWLQQPGFPVVSVKIRGDHVVLTQKRHLTVTPTQGLEYSGLWYIPITYSTPKRADFLNVTPSYWLKPNTSLNIPIANLSNENTWVILNHRYIGYYKVTYDKELWLRLARALKADNYSGIIEQHRCQIVGDILEVEDNFIVVLEVLDYLNTEHKYSVWTGVQDIIYKLLRACSLKDVRRKIAHRIVHWTTTIKKDISFSEAKRNDTLYTLTRTLIFSLTCFTGDRECVKVAARMYNRYRKYGKIDPDIREAVLCTILHDDPSNLEAWNFLWKKFNSEESPIIAKSIAIALGCTSNEAALTKFLDEVVLKKHGSAYKFGLLMPGIRRIVQSHAENVDFLIDYVVKNVNALYDNGRWKMLLQLVVDEAWNENQVTKMDQLAEDAPNTATRVYIQGLAQEARKNEYLKEALQLAIEEAFGTIESNRTTRSSSEVYPLSFYFFSLVLLLMLWDLHIYNVIVF